MNRKLKVNRVLNIFNLLKKKIKTSKFVNLDQYL